MSGSAIVIGIDDYGDESLRLHAAVRDAVHFSRWVTRPDGGGVSPSDCRFLLGRHAANPAPDEEELRLTQNNVPPTKNNIVRVINEVVAHAAAQGQADQLYFYFSGHGITAQLAGREEGALAMPGFSPQHPQHSLALRSLIEHLETTPFKDQFFFIDACRKAWKAEREIGRWPIPRRRDPGTPPVQQFILYATSPGLPAQELGWPDEAVGAFTEVLLNGLAGLGQAKAWSWDRNCYEVRWERLATYVNQVMRQRKYAAPYSTERPAQGWPIQIPQDAGSRGVADRDRDALLASYNRLSFPDVELTLELNADPPFDQADVTVLDSIGSPVVRALRVQGGAAVKVRLPPRTYAARVETPDKRVGTVKAPIELYKDLTDEIVFGIDDKNPGDLPGRDAQACGTITVLSPDPLSVAEISDESGRSIAVLGSSQVYEAKPGFYRVRHLRPERTLQEPVSAAATPDSSEEPQEETFVVLASGEHQQVQLGARPPDPFVVELAETLGGGRKGNYLSPYEGANPIAWAQPSTIVAAAIDHALTDHVSLDQLGAGLPGLTNTTRSGIALYAVAGTGNASTLSDFSVRIWPTGSVIPAASDRTTLMPSEHAVAGVLRPSDTTGLHWLALERDKSVTVLAVPVQPNRISVVIAQVDRSRTRLYQFQPTVNTMEASSSRRLREQEHLQRLLLSGRLDAARPLAEELAAKATEDPMAGLLGGYVLLRLGLYDQLDAVATAIIEVAPWLSDAFVLRGELEAHGGDERAADQAFADAVNAGIPVFGEGLTRLVEGLRVSSYYHPRAALVRHIFRCHLRGSMWAAFTPTRPLQEGQLVISGADLGFEG